MDGTDDPLPWLHCNECSRSFDHHNALDTSGKQLRITKSDLLFHFTSCGHVFCENCVQQRTADGRPFICPPCQAPASVYKLDGVLPRRLEVYLRPATGLLEEAVGVMLFQLGNASELIRGLRQKVAQQKELLSKAKAELAQQRKLREQVAALQSENEGLRKQYFAQRRH